MGGNLYIGVPKEIKTREYRVSLIPKAVESLSASGHRVFVQLGAGEGSGYSDAEYVACGAIMAPSAEEIYACGDMIVKVKEPQAAECQLLREGQILFAFLHLAANPQEAEYLMASGASCYAFETLQKEDGSLPLLSPMSEIAGRLATQAGALCLQRDRGGRGVLLSGATGIDPAQVTVIGGGIVGSNAAQIALGMGAQVSILDLSQDRLDTLEKRFQGSIHCRLSSPETIEEMIEGADLVIGAVLVPGTRAPVVLFREQLVSLPKGAVLVDVAIDQGGCFQTSRVTSYEDPTFVIDGIIHYCVGNMPSAVPRTSSQALSRALLPYVSSLASGAVTAHQNDHASFSSALNISDGKIVNKAVRESLLL